MAEDGGYEAKPCLPLERTVREFVRVRMSRRLANGELPSFTDEEILRAVVPDDVSMLSPGLARQVRVLLTAMGAYRVPRYVGGSLWSLRG